MRAVVAFAFALIACGRIGFDGSSTSSGDDDPMRDGPVAPPDDARLLDAAPSACESAIVVDVGRTSPISTCGRGDRIDGCGTDREEVVFAFTAPVSDTYSFAARDPGTENVSNSVTRATPGCTGTDGVCAGILQFPITAGDTIYFVVEASPGDCATIEFDVQTSGS